MNLPRAKTTTPETDLSGRASVAGKRRLLASPGEPLFLADWERVLFIHYEVEVKALQSQVPFELDLWRGRALVSLVAFTMRDMHPRRGGRLTAWPFKPIATHPFLNVRTYVRHGNESGIYFITEWLPNRMSVLLGPLLYGLPYRFARINYQHTHEQGLLAGCVEAPGRRGKFIYEARLSPNAPFEFCPPASLDEFLLERYTAFTSRGSTRRCFRVWHPPWRQVPVPVSIANDTLPAASWQWFKGASRIGANYSPGFHEVWMGRAHLVK